MIKKLLEKNKKIILFDGECNFCNWWIQLLLKNDSKDVFRFASLQSDIGKEIQQKYNINTEKINSIIVIDHYTDYKSKTTAIFSIIKNMGFPWRLFFIFWIIPKPLRDWMYMSISDNRYQWFGKNHTCMIMTDDIRHKFLEDYE